MASGRADLSMPYDPADLIRREAATAWGSSRPCAHDRREAGSNGANPMRSVLALGLLIALCASANAGRVHHSKPRHVIVHPSFSPSFRPSQGIDPRFPPVLQDQTPSYDDPSKFGGPA